MPELDREINNIAKTIKNAFSIKNVSLEKSIFDSREIKTMRNIVNGKEVKPSEYQLFLENFKKFLDKEFLNKEFLGELSQSEKNVSQEDGDIAFNLKELEQRITKKKENEVYLKILILLTNPIFERLTVSRVLKISDALEFFLNTSYFFQEVDFSTKMNTIHYSLAHAEPLDTAKMLVKLSSFGLLTEENLNKITVNRKLDNDINLLANVIGKLSLSKDGSNHLLTQENLDKLLDNRNLNLEILAKFIQAEDESTSLTQEKFDLAIHLKNLLTVDNIEKIEKSGLDYTKLNNFFWALDKSKILTQENFDQIIQLSESNFSAAYFATTLLGGDQDENLLTQEKLNRILEVIKLDGEKLTQVLNLLTIADILTQYNFNKLIELNVVDFEKIVFTLGADKNKLLTQANFTELLITFLDTRYCDEKAKINFTNGQQSVEKSLTDRLCEMLKKLFSCVCDNAQFIFDEILALFNKKVEKYEEQDASTFGQTSVGGKGFFSHSPTRSPEHVGSMVETSLQPAP